MTRQANAGLTGPVAMTAGEGLVGVWCQGCTVFPPLPFRSDSGSTMFFKGGGSFADGVTPGAAVFSQCGPFEMADLTGSKGFFERVLVALLWCPSVAVS